ncbi:RNA polymerase sigma factor [Planctomycetes bacterium Poly30]|uniref:RNA polymerase sigma factor n=1 Tax=Saltatorellus ferox TaxID=2528018 RepID=A0A518ERS8_9BACT|nr:RNA polymerase sigma factor [Planctomycetes bacterium Poly30]
MSQAADSETGSGTGEGADRSASDRDALFERCYAELRAIANRRMASLPANATLQPTALLHEAYLRVRGRAELTGPAERQFVMYTSRAMRDILVEKARAISALHRRGSGVGLSLDEVSETQVQVADSTGARLDLLDLEQALEELEVAAPQSAEVVQLRYFGGLSVAEVADLLDVSTKTVERRWELARAWLARSMARGLGGQASRPHGGPQVHGQADNGRERD